MRACSGCLERGVAEKGADRGQPRVAGAGAASSVVFEMVKERAYQWRVQFVDLELGTAACRCARAAKVKQQPDCVAVGGDRVRAGVALAHEPVGEKRLQVGATRSCAAPWQVVQPLSRRVPSAREPPADTSTSIPG